MTRPAHLSGPAQRPRLGLGVRVLRHGPEQWQVGLEPQRRVRLPDTAAVRRTLAGLGQAALVTGADPAVLAALDAHGLLHVEGRARGATRPRVLVRAFGAGEVPDPRPLLDQAGLAADGDARADAALLVGFGEPLRDLTDDWVHDGLAHLVVRLHPEEAVVGPLVVPGDGPCLRCLDAHRAADDPRWPQLVHRHAELDAEPRRDGLTDRADPLLAGLALAWAARDLATHLAGGTPGTRRATLRLPPDLGDVELVSWLQHPDCACTW